MRNVILLSIIIAVLAAFFASSNPDGLEKVAETLGFIDRGIERNSLMTDYTLPFLSNAWISAAGAGILGVFLAFGLFWGAARALRRYGNLHALFEK